MQKKILHCIYKFAIQVCKNSFYECCEMDLELFCDYMVFELENKAEDGEENLVTMDDAW